MLSLVEVSCWQTYKYIFKFSLKKLHFLLYYRIFTECSNSCCFWQGFAFLSRNFPLILNKLCFDKGRYLLLENLSVRELRWISLAFLSQTFSINLIKRTDRFVCCSFVNMLFRSIYQIILNEISHRVFFTSKKKTLFEVMSEKAELPTNVEFLKVVDTLKAEINLWGI